MNATAANYENTIESFLASPDTSENWDSSQADETFAHLEELCSLDWIPRSQRNQSLKLLPAF